MKHSYQKECRLQLAGEKNPNMNFFFPVCMEDLSMYTSTCNFYKTKFTISLDILYNISNTPIYVYPQMKCSTVHTCLSFNLNHYPKKCARKSIKCNPELILEMIPITRKIWNKASHLHYTGLQDVRVNPLAYILLIYLNIHFRANVWYIILVCMNCGYMLALCLLPKDSACILRRI